MSKVMLYSYPSTLRSSDEKKGVIKTKEDSFDFIVVNENEVEACLKEGFYRTYSEAKENHKPKTRKQKKTIPENKDKGVEDGLF